MNFSFIIGKYLGGVAHLGERLNGIQEVRGSIPLISTKKVLELYRFRGFFLCYSQMAEGRYFGGVAQGDDVIFIP